jgi:phospholipase/carboxylesterase
MVVASVRAPYAEAGGYAWFPSRGNPIGDPQPGIANDAAEAVLDWLDTLPPAPSTGLPSPRRHRAAMAADIRDAQRN